jgi:2-keto-4-pentenoate hydratase/2-oxohepta-3-ene-1,7-dioic acid hydratase in catechol pathway
MRLARIACTGGPYSGFTTYAQVVHNVDGILSYLPVADPFEPTELPFLLTEPVPGEHVRLLAPCRPRVVVGMAHNTGPADRELPPQAFLKSPHSVVGPGTPIELDANQLHVDGEAELAVVIGTRSRNLTAADVPAAIFGYTCVNDVTDRAAQASDSLWTEAKSRDTFTPLGPWIETDLDVVDLDVLLGDDSGIGPRASTAGLARGVVEVLVYLTSVMTLHPGDVVLTGAPGPSRRLRAGSTTWVRIPGIGELSNPVTVVESPLPVLTDAVSVAAGVA